MPVKSRKKSPQLNAWGGRDDCGVVCMLAILRTLRKDYALIRANGKGSVKGGGGPEGLLFAVIQNHWRGVLKKSIELMKTTATNRMRAARSA